MGRNRLSELGYAARVTVTLPPEAIDALHRIKTKKKIKSISGTVLWLIRKYRKSP
jgi:hypothetical protein